MGLLEEIQLDAVERLNQRFLRLVEQSEDDGCWLWKGARWLSGYGMFYILGRQYRAHRVAYELFVGPIPQGLIVLHSCDTPACVRPGHLTPGTPKENTADMLAKGRRGPTPPKNPARGERNGMCRSPGLAAGEANGRARLTSAAVRALRDGSLSVADAVQQFDVTQEAVSMAIRRKTWQSV